MKVLNVTIIFTLLLCLPAAVIAQQSLKLSSVKFEGNKILTDGELLDQMNSRPKKTFEKIFFWKKRPDLVEPVLQDDISRLQSFYNRNGFLNPEISYKTDISGKKVRVAITIKENGFVKISKIDFNLEGDSLSAHLLDSLRPKLPLKDGNRFTDKDVFDSEALLKKGFSDLGYPFVNAGHKIEVEKEKLLCSVFLNINAGARSFFDGVSIKGDSLIPEKFIRKYVMFSEDQLYSAKKINKTQQDIFGTGLFRYVVLSSQKDSVKDNRIPVNIMVKELPVWQLEAGVGYGTEDRLRLAGQLTKLNFLGGARKIIINAKTSYFVPYSFDVRFVQPDIFFPKLDFVLNPFALREREISYRIDRWGSSINFLYRLSKIFNGQVSYSFEHVKLLQPGDVLPDSIGLKHNKSVFGIGGRIDLSNDPFYPSRGFKINVNLSYAIPGFGSRLHYYKAELSLIDYLSLDRDVTLATKLSTGFIRSVSSSVSTPVEERFYLGGASSLRGWGRHRISPVDEAGLALGGNTMLEASAELRYPVYDIIHGVIFMDAGNAWAGNFRYDLTSLHYDAGIGLRLRTPIGPVRVDFATPVINDSFRLQFFISVGQAF
jgi:outer membrane protein insertion porin family